MFTSVAGSCVRHGRRLSLPVVKLSLYPATVGSHTGLNVRELQHGSQQRSLKLLTSALWRLSEGAAARCVSLSATSQRERDPRCSSTSDLEDTEKFGSLSGDMSSRRSYRKSSPDIQDLRHRDGEEEQEEEEEESWRPPMRRNTPYWYFLQCKTLIRDNKLQEALDLFSRDMLHVERLQPEEYNYTILIGGCGRAGQMKKAFRLYNDMKKRGLNAVDATYTALFNACAEFPLKQAGLQQALKLEQELRRKNYQLSTITYHALLKTHAITNNLQACIHILREMMQNGHAVTQETFHYLMMGCLMDKDAGFRLALQIWRQMLKSGLRPDSQNYNLLLRTARDCGIGDANMASDVLLSLERESQKEKKHGSVSKSKSRREDVIDVDLLERQLFLLPASCRDDVESVSRQKATQLIPVRQTENISLPPDSMNSTAPNLLDYFEGTKNAVVSLGTVVGASDRLALIGGPAGFLEKMAANGLSPDLRTLTMLGDMINPSYESLQMLLKVAKQHQVKLDVAFFNAVIRRASKAGDLQAAKSVLRVMQQRNVSMDVKTFGCLALGCKSQKDGLQLLKDMEEAGLRPNVQVFSALIGQAIHRLDYVYLKTILKSMSNMEVWPNKVIIKQLEFAAQYPPNYDQYKSRNNYLVHIDGFRGFYQQWLRFMPAQDAEDENAELQTETDDAKLKTESEDRLMEAQRNQRAAARRYNSHKLDRTRSAAL